MMKFIILTLSLMLAQMSFAQPLNDNCTGAITLIPGLICVTTAGTKAGATQSLFGCTGTANDDVWNTFTATSTGHSINVTGNGAFNPVMQIYQAACGVGRIACINQTAAGGTEFNQRP